MFSFLFSLITAVSATGDTCMVLNQIFVARDRLGEHILPGDRNGFVCLFADGAGARGIFKGFKDDRVQTFLVILTQEAVDTVLNALCSAASLDRY